MSKTTFHRVEVGFGDCDPAGIVFHPNFSRRMDAASPSFFVQCGVPPWRELVKTRGIAGTPLLEIQTKSSIAATDGETLEIATHVEERRARVFVQIHRVTRARADGGTDLVCEGREVRAFVHRDPADADRLRALPVPDDIRQHCTCVSTPTDRRQP